MTTATTIIMTMTMITIIVMTTKHTLTRNLLQIKMQFIDTSIPIMDMITVTIMIMHIPINMTMTMTIMTITITNIMIIIMGKEKRVKAVLLQTCSKTRMEMQTAKHSITFISSSDLSRTLLEISKKRLILTNSLSKKSWPILRLSRR
jgi:hypothetical protein